MSEVHIKVTVTRSGGFAGIERRAAVDTTRLPADRSAEIRSLVRQLDPAALGDPTSASALEGSGGRDRFQYDVEISVGDDVHRFSIDEAAVPKELKPLLDAVLRYGQD